jgi:signal transduction histidine kinase
VSAEVAATEQISAALAGLGNFVQVSDHESAVAAIASDQAMIAIVDDRLPARDIENLLQAGDPGRIILLVSEFQPGLLGAGGHIQIPRELDSHKLADAVVRLIRWRREADSVEATDVRVAEMIRVIRRVRHDINNPLTSVMAETQLILMDADDLSEEQKRGLETIEAMAGRIRDLTQELHEITVTD